MIIIHIIMMEQRFILHMKTEIWKPLREVVLNDLDILNYSKCLGKCTDYKEYGLVAR